MSERQIIIANCTPARTLAADLLKLARAALQGARREAAETRLRARRQAAAHLRRARLRARRTGLTDGRRAAAAEHAQKLLELEVLRRDLLHGAENDCLEMCLALTHEILAAELATNSRSLAARVRRALQSLIESRRTVIKVHPAHLEQAKKELREDLASGLISIEGCAQLAPGDARLETPSGTAELCWQRQFEAVAAALRQKTAERTPC